MGVFLIFSPPGLISCSKTHAKAHQETGVNYTVFLPRIQVESTPHIDVRIFWLMGDTGLEPVTSCV